MFQGVQTLSGPVVPQGSHFGAATFKLSSREDTYRMLVQCMMVPPEAHKLSIEKVCVAGLDLSSHFSSHY